MERNTLEVSSPTDRQRRPPRKEWFFFVQENYNLVISVKLVWHPSYTTTHLESEVQGMFSGDLVNKKKYKKNLVGVKKIYILEKLKLVWRSSYTTPPLSYMPEKFYTETGSINSFTKI